MKSLRQSDLIASFWASVGISAAAAEKAASAAASVIISEREVRFTEISTVWISSRV
jgi:hypothetical protein